MTKLVPFLTNIDNPYGDMIDNNPNQLFVVRILLARYTYC